MRKFGKGRKTPTPPPLLQIGLTVKLSMLNVASIAILKLCYYIEIMLFLVWTQKIILLRYRKILDPSIVSQILLQSHNSANRQM